MMHEPRLSYLVTVSRHSNLMHSQMMTSRDEARALADRYETMPGVEADITEVHDPAETNLTAHTRELIEGLEVHHLR